MKYLKNIVIVAIGLILATLFILYPAPADRILNLQNYLITVGGIISAFVIAYLSAKIFSIKTERENRQREIDRFAKRLTAFRQLLYFVMHSQDFWQNYGDIAKFKKSYPGLNYARLRSTGKDELRDKFWFEEKTLSHATISLYSAMEAIYGENEKTMVPYAYDQAIKLKYSIEDLESFYEPSNQIWYYLEGRYHKHGIGNFADKGLDPLFTENFRELVAKADIKQRGKSFHREVIAAVRSEFYEYVIPIMAGLINANTGIPTGLLRTFYSLISIMTFGVLFPIILQAIAVPNVLNVFLTLTFVLLTVLSLINFLFEFYNLLDEELHPNKK